MATGVLLRHVPAGAPHRFTFFSPPDHPSHQNRRYCFAAQGRLDNREALCQRLSLPGHAPERSDDRALMFAAFLKFLDQTPDHLDGEWLFAVYDKLAHSLFIAQSPCGSLALYYYLDEDLCLFSSSLDWLLARPEVPKDLDLKRIIGVSAIVRNLEPDTTAFSRIRRLMPGHCMMVTADTMARNRYWFPEQIPLNTSLSHDEAVARLWDLFSRAVDSALICDGPVGSFLSGGLDSGSVVSVAARILGERGKQLHTHSHVPLFDLSGLGLSGRPGDERPWVQAVVDRYPNIVPQFHTSSHTSPLQGVKTLLRIFHEPVHGAANAFWIADIYRAAAAQGQKVLLAGHRGNGTISFEGVPGQLGVKGLVKRVGFSPTLVRKLLARPYHRFRGWVSGQAWDRAGYLHPEMIRHAGELGIRTPMVGHATAKDTHTRIMLGFQDAGERWGWSGQALRDFYGVERRDPTGGKALVEFMLSLPNGLFVGPGGQTRYMVKQMMKGRLPDKVLFQPSKGLQSADITLRLLDDLPEIREVVTDFPNQIFGLPLFDIPRLGRDVARLAGGTLGYAEACRLLRTVGIMVFLTCPVDLSPRFRKTAPLSPEPLTA